MTAASKGQGLSPFPHRQIRGLGFFLALCLLPACLPALPATLGFGSFGEASFGGGASLTTGRPLLPRTGLGATLSFELNYGHWIPLAVGVGEFVLNPSSPDASLFRYRGFGGASAFLEMGARFPIGGIGGLFLARSELQILVGGGLAAIEDSGTTLVSLTPLIKIDTRLVLPFPPPPFPSLFRDLRWVISLPMETHLRASSLSALASLGIGIAYFPGGGK